ncbi:TPA: hypothetical protein NJ055_004930 [Vibrio parahaemolyticus]|uniref:hypothetical protein n=1 Tax=Vibrio alginolyticus TaxID=663 RepID=UPI0037546654|nr:hypothetical protein [Vibrio parahaemolyticus]HCG5940756.1 hypothetical protein [Vibrio parahaemolyticus]
MTLHEKEDQSLALERARSVIDCAYDALCLNSEGVMDDLCWALKGLYEYLVVIDSPSAQQLASLAHIVSENLSSGMEFKHNTLLNILTVMLRIAQKEQAQSGRPACGGEIEGGALI